jgi:flavodoxin
MNDTIAIYYSQTGNNRFIAKKLSKEIQADLEQIETKAKSIFPLLLLTWFKKGAKIKPLDIDLTKYDRVILLGPIWMGNLISPLRGFVKRYGKDIQNLIFITVCGGTDEGKDRKYGSESVFNEMRKLLPNTLTACYEISTRGVGGESSTTVGGDSLSESTCSESSFGCTCGDSSTECTCSKTSPGTSGKGSPPDLPLLSEELFHGEIKDRFDGVVKAIKERAE